MKNIERKKRKMKYPLLGEAQQMFEGDNIYVVHERAIVDKIYSFICPRCHSVFISKTINDDVVKIKCPECDTYICFSSQGEKQDSTIRRTQIINGSESSTLEGVLVWSNNGHVESKVLMPGEMTIGRKSNDVPSDIGLDDGTASRRSVKIVVTRGEQTGKYIFKLVVLRTTNAVSVNQNALYNNSEIYLNYGDTIKLGETTLTLLANNY